VCSGMHGCMHGCNCAYSHFCHFFCLCMSVRVYVCSGIMHECMHAYVTVRAYIFLEIPLASMAKCFSSLSSMCMRAYVRE
jgi:hypothetical protein